MKTVLLFEKGNYQISKEDKSVLFYRISVMYSIKLMKIDAEQKKAT